MHQAATAHITAVEVSLVEAGRLPNENFRRMFDLWLDARGTSDLPPVSTVTPFSFPRDLLPGISIMEVCDGAKRYLVRLVGTRTVAHVGMDLTGTWGDDVEGGAEVRRACDFCVESRWPIYLCGRTVWAVHDFNMHQSLTLPYAAPDGSVRRLITYVEFVKA